MADDSDEIIILSDSESNDQGKCPQNLQDNKTKREPFGLVNRQELGFTRKRCERKRLRHRHASYPECSGSSSEDEDTTNMKWTSTMLNAEESSTKLGGVTSRGRFHNARKTVSSPRSGRCKALRLSRKTTKPLPKMETIVISSSTSEGELDTKEIPHMTGNGLSIMPISFPPSPQSDLGEDLEQDLTKILEIARSSRKLQIDSYTPASPASLGSHRDSSPDLSDDDASGRWSRIADGHALAEFRFDNERISNVKNYRRVKRENNSQVVRTNYRGVMSSYLEQRNSGLERVQTSYTGGGTPGYFEQSNSGVERDQTNYIGDVIPGYLELSNSESENVQTNYRGDVNPNDLEREHNSDMSDFEEVLDKSTAIALSQKPDLSSDESVESDEELPNIDYYKGETMEAGTSCDLFDWVDPPVLGKYGQSPTRHEVDNHTNFLLDVEDDTLKVSPDETEDHSERNDIDLPSSLGDHSNEHVASNYVRPNGSILKVSDISPQHIWISSQGSKSSTAVTKRPTHLTSHMVNLIEACYDEHFIDASVSLIGTFTTTRIVPSSETINYLLKSVLLGPGILDREACQAYHALQHINRLHPITSHNYEIDWELLSIIICGLLGTATTSFEQTSEPIVQHSNADLQVARTDRSLLALKFLVCVMENSVFQSKTDSYSRNSGSTSKETFILERHMVKDLLLWLEESITLDLSESVRDQQLVQQLVEQLQKIISISCLEEHGDHLDYVTFSLVHKLDELSLQQKQTLLQTSCHKLRCKLVELYLETRYEVPSCPACRTDCSKVYLPQRLSIAKMFVLHIHQRPLEATQNVNDERDFVEEETGERVHCSENMIAGSDKESAVVGRHCPICSKRIPLTIEQCEEFLLLLVSLLQSFILCTTIGSNLSFTEEDSAILGCLRRHVDTLSTDLLRSCPKHSPKSLLYLKQMALFQDTFM